MNRLSKDINEIIGKYIHQSLQNEVHEMLLKQTEDVKCIVDIVLFNDCQLSIDQEIFARIRKCKVCLSYMVTHNTKIKFECYECSNAKGFP